jgi:hypothetical protein
MASSGKYGTTIENTNKAVDKAKSKKDGVYTLNGMYYRVKEKCVTHIAGYGEILQRAGYFNVLVVKYNTSDECIKMMKNITDC